MPFVTSSSGLSMLSNITDAVPGSTSSTGPAGSSTDTSHSGTSMPSRHASPRRSPRLSPAGDDSLATSLAPEDVMMDESAVFERDVEHNATQERSISGSEAIDLAAAPILSEVATAITLDTPLPLPNLPGTPGSLPFQIMDATPPPGTVASALEQALASLPSSRHGSPRSTSPAHLVGSANRQRSETWGTDDAPSLVLSSPSMNGTSSPVSVSWEEEEVGIGAESPVQNKGRGKDSGDGVVVRRRMSLMSYADLIQSERESPIFPLSRSSHGTRPSSPVSAPDLFLLPSDVRKAKAHTVDTVESQQMTREEAAEIQDPPIPGMPSWDVFGLGQAMVGKVAGVVGAALGSNGGTGSRET